MNLDDFCLLDFFGTYEIDTYPLRFFSDMRAEATCEQSECETEQFAGGQELCGARLCRPVAEMGLTPP